jgi:hypothetical protein
MVPYHRAAFFISCNKRTGVATATQTGKDDIAAFVLKTFEEFKSQRADDEVRWSTTEDALYGRDFGSWKEGEAGNRKVATADETKQEDQWRSKDYVSLIKTKTVAATAVVIDTILQGGRVPFAVNDYTDVYEEIEAEFSGQPIQKQDTQAAKDLQEKKIRQQIADGKVDRHLMKCLFSGALFGKGIIKSPVIKTISKKFSQQVVIQPPPQISMIPGMSGISAMSGASPQQPQQQPIVKWQRVRKEYTIPTIEWISVWEFFPDYEADDIQKGRGVIQRNYISAYQLREKAKTAQYDLEELEKAIEENNLAALQKYDANESPRLRDVVERKNNLEIIELHGLLPYQKLTAYAAKKRGDLYVDTQGIENDGRDVECITTVVNGRTIGVVINELGHRIFHQFLWEDRLDNISGYGVADNVKDDQVAINGTIRAIKDNAALAGNVMGFIKPHALNNDQTLVFKPGLLKNISDEVQTAQEAFQQVIVQDVSGSLYNLLELQKQFADDNSNLPRLISGETAVSKKANTAFEVNEMTQNAGKYLSLVIRNFDEGIIEPGISDIYDYNMMDEGDSGKGNFVINATGFSSFQNNIIKQQRLMQLMQQILASPQVQQEMKFRKVLEEVIKGQDFDVDEFMKSEEEKAQEQAQSIEATVGRIAQALGMTPQQLMQTVSQREQQVAAPAQALPQVAGAALQ